MFRINALIFQLWVMSASNLNTARPEWTAGQVSVSAASDFRLVLEGKASNGGFAIDQLVFTPGGCKSKEGSVPSHKCLLELPRRTGINGARKVVRMNLWPLRATFPRTRSVHSLHRSLCSPARHRRAEFKKVDWPPPGGEEEGRGILRKLGGGGRLGLRQGSEEVEEAQGQGTQESELEVMLFGRRRKWAPVGSGSRQRHKQIFNDVRQQQQETAAAAGERKRIATEVNEIREAGKNVKSDPKNFGDEKEANAKVAHSSTLQESPSPSGTQSSTSRPHYKTTVRYRTTVAGGRKKKKKTSSSPAATPDDEPEYSYEDVEDNLVVMNGDVDFAFDDDLAEVHLPVAQSNEVSVDVDGNKKTESVTTRQVTKEFGAFNSHTRRPPTHTTPSTTTLSASLFVRSGGTVGVGAAVQSTPFPATTVSSATVPSVNTTTTAAAELLPEIFVTYIPDKRDAGVETDEEEEEKEATEDVRTGGVFFGGENNADNSLDSCPILALALSVLYHVVTSACTCLP